MDPDTFRGDIGVPDPDVYWRRRISVLTALLVVVALVVWACTRTSDESTGAADGPAASKSALAGEAGDSGDSGGAAAARTAADTSASPTPQPARRSGECQDKDLVVHLEGLEEVYGADVRPRFLIMLVNTGSEACTVDVGPRGLEMRITSGSDRVWSSADCVGGEREELRRLERGVPFIRTIKWNRRRSGRDCSASHPPARAGTYVATVVAAGSPREPKAVFHLR